MATKPFFDWPGPLAFAHRGGAGAWPENTMPAFEGAIRLGYRYVETDVHVTADGVLLAFHDAKLDRVTDRTGAISELPYSEVSRALVDGREPIPLLEDILGTWPEVRVNIDPKHDAAVEALARTIERSRAVDRVCIGSFSDRRLARLRKLLGPGLATSCGPRSVALLMAGTRRRFVEDCAQVPPHRGRVRIVNERFLRLARARKLDVHVWTVDDPAVM